MVNKKRVLNLVVIFCFYTCAIRSHFHTTIRFRKYCRSSKSAGMMQKWTLRQLEILYFHDNITGAVNSPSDAFASLASQCLTDSFSVTNPGGGSNPVLCGTNTGEHMYVDASDACNELNFQLGTNPVGGGVTTGLATRSWSIKATQVKVEKLIDKISVGLQYEFHFCFSMIATLVARHQQDAPSTFQAQPLV